MPDDALIIEVALHELVRRQALHVLRDDPKPTRLKERIDVTVG